MSDSSADKILVCGDVEGEFDKLFRRVSNILSKQPTFSCLFCVGDFFGSNPVSWQPYLDGTKQVPLSTYILGPNKPEHVHYYKHCDGGGELCDNVTYLGRHGLYTTASKLSVAYVSGVLNADSSTCQLTSNDVVSLAGNVTAEPTFAGVDLLLTSDWPKDVWRYADKPFGIDDLSNCGSDLLADLDVTLKPRYHVAASYGSFYERRPYRNHKVLQEQAVHTTRFISLATVSNCDKLKYLYAFSITPLAKLSSSQLAEQPNDVTECPFKSTGVKFDKASLIRGDDMRDASQQFFYNEKEISKMKRKAAGHADRTVAKQKREETPCWFCLSSPEVAKHLVVSVGDFCYLALPKGGIDSNHVMILPISHFRSSVDSPKEVLQEVQRYKDSLSRLYASRGLRFVGYERNYRQTHLQVQCVGVPSVPPTTERALTYVELRHPAVDLVELPPTTELSQIARSCYFLLEIGDESGSFQRLFHQIDGKFDLNFGRGVLCDLLSCPEKTDWHDCIVPKEREVSMVAEFKNSFKDFDFTDDL